MPDRARLVKLVRDGIGKFIGGEGRVSYEPVDPETHVRLLRRKLIEEAVEYLEHPSLGELADVLEVVHGLAYADLGIDWPTLVAEAQDKRQERGGFEQGTAMFIRSTAPARHEGEHAVAQATSTPLSKAREEDG